ncbi:MAG: polyprenol monophosphomannose synthase [Chitinophagaceae bacterium]|nr:polyprenol monophosphomannose synthase [Chitinophagaceae bacterium]
MEKLVIIPTYNERENIAEILKAVFSMGKNYHVLVVDDGSPDGTGALVKELFNIYPGQLFIEERSGKSGLGTAYIHGFKWAIERRYEYIFEMDADFSHNPNDLERLYLACADGVGDVAIGSRYAPGGKIENWPWLRHFYSKGGALYTRILTWIPVNDPTAGFVCYKRKVLEAINFDAIHFVGYAFQVEMKFAAWKLGFNIVEVPITFIDRKVGVSKMNKGILKEGILGVLRLQWQSMFKNYRRKVNSSAIAGSADSTPVSAGN